MEKLIEKFKKGNKTVFSELINCIEKKLYAIARSRLYNYEDAKDAVQDAILQIYLNLNKLKDIKKFNSWCTSILINSCNMILKKRQKNGCLSYEELNNGKLILSDNEYLHMDNNIDFFSMIKSLSVEERTIVTMYYSNEYTTREISEILNINENTVRSKLKRSKQKIRYMFGGVEE